MTKPRVLLVDDDKPFRALVGALLQRQGCDVVEAHTGAEALAAVQKGGVELVIVDGLLPDTDGIQWVRKLRAGGSTLPVVFVSAFWRDARSFQTLTQELGVRRVIHKPVIPEVLWQQVALELAALKPAAVSPAAAAPAGELDLAAEAEALKRTYAAELPGRATALRRALHDALAARPRDLEHAPVRDLAHRLRGTAGSYGFAEVGQAAGRAEDALLAADWEGAERAVRDVVALAEAAAARTAAPSEPGPPPAARVLLVGADAPRLAALAGTLQGLALDVATAGTALDALTRARELAPAAVLVDVAEGQGVEGAAMVEALRDVPGCEAVPVALLTADDRLQARVAAAHAGANLLLPRATAGAAVELAARQLLALTGAGRPRVLVVDDDPQFTRHAEGVLRAAGMAVTVVNDGARVFDALEGEAPEVLLLDVRMPGVSGYDICRIVRATPRLQHVSVLFVTAGTTPEARVAAFRAGADDFIDKPVVAEELLSRVRVRVERSRLLRERSERDALTGLLLRRPLVEQLSARLAEAQRHRRPLALALLDVDHFKQVNDTHGHLAGDRVLAGLGALLARRFRAEDLRGRWGGEEFVLVLPGTEAAVARDVVDRVRQDFARLTFPRDQGGDFQATLSGGVAAFPADGESPEALVAAADRRLYTAKAAGRNRVGG